MYVAKGLRSNARGGTYWRLLPDDTSGLPHNLLIGSPHRRLSSKEKLILLGPEDSYAFARHVKTRFNKNLWIDLCVYQVTHRTPNFVIKPLRLVPKIDVASEIGIVVSGNNDDHSQIEQAFSVGKVIEMNEQRTMIDGRLENPSLVVKGSSGSPIITRKGVVGVLHTSGDGERSKQSKLGVKNAWDGHVGHHFRATTSSVLIETLRKLDRKKLSFEETKILTREQIVKFVSLRPPEDNDWDEFPRPLEKLFEAVYN